MKHVSDRTRRKMRQPEAGSGSPETRHLFHPNKPLKCRVYPHRQAKPPPRAETRTKTQRRVEALLSGEEYDKERRLVALEATSSSLAAGSQRSSSWSSSGRGSPSRIRAFQTRIAAVPLSCQPCSSGPRTSEPSWTSTPNSSRISRRSAASQPSPGSTLPPGNSHRPAKDSGAVLRATRSSEGFERESRIAAPTICFRGCSTEPSLPTVRRLP